ncbi:MAG: GDSL-type esterase/lipase family protein [Fuerstiella sp.]|nr:GDSL-type esterase/lipase family protein [Fuerstiella sp.]
MIRIVPLLLLLACGCGSPSLTNNPPRNLTICCFGDSLVTGVGASARETTSYPAQLGRILNAEVTNWGASGDTTIDGVNRLGRFNDHKFGIVVVTLGGNDILRRVNWQETKENLAMIFSELTSTGNFVVFTGVVGPLNRARSKHYGTLCDIHGVLYVPDILDGITSNSGLLADQIHPNDDGYRLMAERIAKALRSVGMFVDSDS